MEYMSKIKQQVRTDAILGDSGTATEYLELKPTIDEKMSTKEKFHFKEIRLTTTININDERLRDFMETGDLHSFNYGRNMMDVIFPTQWNLINAVVYAQPNKSTEEELYSNDCSVDFLQNGLLFTNEMAKLLPKKLCKKDCRKLLINGLLGGLDDQLLESAIYHLRGLDIPFMEVKHAYLIFDPIFYPDSFSPESRQNLFSNIDFSPDLDRAKFLRCKSRVENMIEAIGFDNEEDEE